MNRSRLDLRVRFRRSDPPSAVIQVDNSILGLEETEIAIEIELSN